MGEVPRGGEWGGKWVDQKERAGMRTGCGLGVDRYQVRPGLSNSSIIKVFRVHESSSFVNIVDKSCNVDVIKNVVG